MKTFKGWKVPEPTQKNKEDYCYQYFNLTSCGLIECKECLFGNDSSKKDFEEWKAQQ